MSNTCTALMPRNLSPFESNNANKFRRVCLLQNKKQRVDASVPNKLGRVHCGGVSQVWGGLCGAWQTTSHLIIVVQIERDKRSLVNLPWMSIVFAIRPAWQWSWEASRRHCVVYQKLGLILCRALLPRLQLY